MVVLLAGYWVALNPTRSLELEASGAGTRKSPFASGRLMPVTGVASQSRLLFAAKAMSSRMSLKARCRRPAQNGDALIPVNLPSGSRGAAVGEAVTGLVRVGSLQRLLSPLLCPEQLTWGNPIYVLRGPILWYQIVGLEGVGRSGWRTLALLDGGPAAEGH